MKKVFSIVIVVFVFILSVVTASAAETKLYCERVSADSNGLFDIPVCMKSDSVICACGFTVEYDKKAVAFRKAYTDINSAKLEFNDIGGRVKIIFLSPNGVRINKKSVLLKLSFKPLRAGSSAVKISASDCVDNKAKSFEPPKAVSGKISINGKSDSSYKTGRSGKGAAAKSNGKSADDGLKFEDYDVKSDKVGNTEIDQNGDGLIHVYDTVTHDKESPLITIVIIISAAAAAVLFAVIKLRGDKKKTDKDKKDKE